MSPAWTTRSGAAAATWSTTASQCAVASGVRADRWLSDTTITRAALTPPTLAVRGYGVDGSVSSSSCPTMWRWMVAPASSSHATDSRS